MRQLMFGTAQILALLQLSSCATTPAAIVGSAPPPPSGSEQPAAVVAITREFLPHQATLQSTFSETLPTAYLLLSADAKKAGERMCKAWMGLPTAKQVNDLDPSAQTARTYWLLGQGSSTTDNCKKLVANYDFAKADLFRTAKGLPLGSLLAVRFPDDRVFYVDLTKASQAQDRALLLSWYTVASTSEGGVTVKSNTIAARMQRAVCNDSSGIVASIVQYAAGAIGPFGFIIGVGKQEMCKLSIV